MLPDLSICFVNSDTCKIFSLTPISTTLESTELLAYYLSETYNSYKNGKMPNSTVSKLKASTVRDDFSEIINRVAYGKEHVILTRRGKDLAAIIPADQLKLFRTVLEQIEDELDITEAKRRLSNKKQSRISYKFLRKELGLK